MTVPTKSGQLGEPWGSRSEGMQVNEKEVARKIRQLREKQAKGSNSSRISFFKLCVCFWIFGITPLMGLVQLRAQEAEGHASKSTGKISGSPRILQSLNRDWTFQYFPNSKPDTQFVSPQADDSAWPAVALPHTWSVYETTHDLHPFIEHASEREDSYWWYGWGWYRKQFALSSKFSQKQVFLEFDGVQKVCFIYINGHLAGEHKGGYTSFSIDITRWVNFGSPNLIAVQVSNRRDDDLGHVPPMTAGNFDVYGGIYRTVRLVLTDKVHIPYQGSAESEGGSFITTPKVSAESATVHDTTWIRNDRKTSADLELLTRILDKNGKIISQKCDSEHLSAGELKSVDQDFAPIDHPHLWSPTTPYLYRAYTEVLENGKVVDAFESTFGVRWFNWNYSEHRLYLNGAPIRLIGTNRHQEFPWLGDAMPMWLQEQDLHDMRWNIGFNFQRTAHYPQNPGVYDFCDRNGILVVEESPNIKDIDFGRDVQMQNMREMIRRDRNHPSIVMWSMGNETDHPADSAWGWQEDKTRIIHLRRGTNGGDHVMTTEEDLAFEQALRCTVRGWYNSDAHDFGTETGEPQSGQVTGTEEWQHTEDASYLLEHSQDNVVVFLYNDHGAERIYRNSPLREVNPKGWVDAYRFPKYVYYLWQANFTENPMVFIHPWPWQQRYLGQEKTITIDSNCDTVELLLNGRSLGTGQPSNINAHIVTFDNVAVTDETLTAVGRKNGKVVRETLSFPGAPVRLMLHVRDSHLVADRSGLAVLQVDAVDAQNRPVPYIHPEITWSIAGEGHFVGPTHYKTDTDKNGSLTGEMYIDLPTANIIRTTSSVGDIQVKVSSPGLEPANITLHSYAAPPDVDGITEYPLSDVNRHPVVRDASFHPAILSKKSIRFSPVTQDYQLAASTLEEATASMDHFIREQNPKLDTKSVIYRVVLEKLGRLLFENQGRLIADWYNFSVIQYSDAYQLAQTIKHSPIPEAMQQLLSEDYARRIVMRGQTFDIDHENSLLDRALANAQVVQVGGTSPITGIKQVEAKTIGSLLESTYSEWKELNPEQQKRALKWLFRLNPVLSGSANLPDANQLAPNGLLLLPDWDVLKSIM